MDTMNNKDRRTEEEQKMFDLIKKGDTPVRDELRRVEEGLDRFKRETGYDFVELVQNRRTLTSMLINGIDNKDLDEDETTLQNLFGPLQRKCWESED